MLKVSGGFITATAPRTLLLAILVVAIGFGFYFYSPFFASRSPYLWVFLPNSPLAILAALAAIYLWKKSDFLNLLACSYLGKFGAWTIFVMLLHPQVYFRQEIFLESLALYIVPHAAMVFLALLCLPKKRKTTNLVLVLLVLLANDYANYWLSLIAGPPQIIPLWNMGLVSAVSLCLSIGFGLFYHMHSEKIRNCAFARKVNSIFA
ncbi:DUF1405 domain-containing protein [Candidatus Parvarchaeota archaeon]|nr:DUF1405 domain-containing protein [Candidatus Parvarchaeota archaeon]